MLIRVHFYSYFREITACERLTEELPSGSTVEALLAAVYRRYPKLESFRKSTLVAVGVDYQRGDYQLQDGEEVSLFPPVQGG